MGDEVREVNIWTGSVPPNSFVWLNPLIRMARPEYFFYRKANELEEHDALMLLAELLGPYTTKIVNPDVPDGVVWQRDEPHMNLVDLYEYLSNAYECADCRKPVDLVTKFLIYSELYVGEYIDSIKDNEFMPHP